LSSTLRAATEADQTIARVVWYYYVGNLTQQEIADRLGLTRLRVNRIIGQARADGLVRIEVRSPLADCVALGAALVERFGLQGASVVPALEDLAEQRRVIGEEVGQVLDPLLRDGSALGVGWGRTLRAALSRLPHRAMQNGSVVSLMGGLTHGSGINTFEVSTQYAEALAADCWYLAAPLYCPSEESRRALLAHEELADVMDRARAVDVALLTCGDLSEKSLIASMQTVRDHREALRAQGAAGDMLGSFIDETGRAVDHPLNRRVVALSPEELRAVPVSILASGGLNKVAIIRGILSGGYVNRIVTDEACARALLAPR
jgi:DNA-binding transcriptional regulator LsrR (DeoR family)